MDITLDYSTLSCTSATTVTADLTITPVAGSGSGMYTVDVNGTLTTGLTAGVTTITLPSGAGTTITVIDAGFIATPCTANQSIFLSAGELDCSGCTSFPCPPTGGTCDINAALDFSTLMCDGAGNVTGDLIITNTGGSQSNFEVDINGTITTGVAGSNAITMPADVAVSIVVTDLDFIATPCVATAVDMTAAQLTCDPNNPDYPTPPAGVCDIGEDVTGVSGITVSEPNCSADSQTYTVDIVITSGTYDIVVGDASANVSVTAAGVGTYTFNYTSGDTYDLTVTDLNFIATPCVVQFTETSFFCCNPIGGAISTDVTEACANGTVTATATGFNPDTATYTEEYLVVDPVSNTIVDRNATGVFTMVNTGVTTLTYDIYSYNYKTIDGEPVPALTVGTAFPGANGINNGMPPPPCYEITGPATVTVYPLPNILSDQQPTIEVCSSEAAVIYLSSDVADTVFDWTGDNGSSGTGDVVDIPTNLGTTNTVITYTINATGPAPLFCTNSTTVAYTVYPGPLADPFVTTPPINGFDIACTGGLVELEAGATGGDGNYTYEWSTTEEFSPITGVKAGVYQLTVTDGNGCSSVATIEVTEPPLLQCPLALTDISCIGADDGEATVTPTGGVPNYTIEWTGPGGPYTGTTISNLAPGAYDLLVTDDNDCTCTQSFMIEAPTSLVTNSFGANNDFEGENGGIGTYYYNVHTLEIMGGTLPYQLEWDKEGYVRHSIEFVDNDGDGESDGIIVTIIYSDNANWEVSVTDLSGCGTTDEGDLVFSNNDMEGSGDVNTILDIDNYTTTADTDSATGSGTGSVTINPTGGDCGGAYTYVWGGPGGYTATTQNLTDIDSGWYTVTVTCGDEATIGWYWVEPGRRGRGKINGSALTAYPNPFNSATTIEFEVAETTTAKVDVFAIDGSLIANIFDGNVSANTPYQVSFKANDLPNGSYIVRLVAANGSVQTSKLVITR